MRVAVTGANGLLGGEAVLQLAGGHEVLALGRGPCRLGAGPFTWAETDLGDGRSVEAALRVFGAEAVLHAGAATDVDACERDPELAWRVNVGGTEQVARACRALGARLVAVSSAVARVAVVYSGRPGAKNTFATQVVEKLSRGEPVKAFSDQYVSTTLAASGAAMCLELLLETDYRGVLHTSDATVLDRVEFARRIARRFGLEGEIVPVRTADVKLLAPRPLRGGLRVERAAGLLRNKPLSIDEALERFHAEWARRRDRTSEIG